MSDSLRKEWNVTFIQHMRNRCTVGVCRYGPVLEDPQGFISRLKKKVAEYEKTGNLDLLPDIANYAMFEATVPQHRQAHWPDSLESTDEENAKKVGIDGTLYTLRSATEEELEAQRESWVRGEMALGLD